MWHIGIDLHREFIVMAAVRDNGEVMEPVKIACRETESILEVIHTLTPFRVVVEASGTYRWLYDLLRPHGIVLLAHPLRLRAMIQRRSKTDKLDAQLLANLLRINQIPLAYIPPEPYQRLRDLARCRAKLGQDRAKAKIKLRDLLARQNLLSPYKTPFGPRGLAWFRGQDFGLVGNMLRDELLARLGHYDRQIAVFDEQLEPCRADFPQTAALTDIHGIGIYSALLIVAEFGDENDPRGRGVEELLHARAKAFERKDRPGGGGAETSRDLLEAFAALATRTRREGGVRETRGEVVSRTTTAVVGPQRGLVRQSSALCF
jgi:transposase